MLPADPVSHSNLPFFASGGWNFRFWYYFWLVAICIVQACARRSYTTSSAYIIVPKWQQWSGWHTELLGSMDLIREHLFNTRWFIYNTKWGRVNCFFKFNLSCTVEGLGVVWIIVMYAIGWLGNIYTISYVATNNGISKFSATLCYSSSSCEMGRSEDSYNCLHFNRMGGCSQGSSERLQNVMVKCIGTTCELALYSMIGLHRKY